MNENNYFPQQPPQIPYVPEYPSQTEAPDGAQTYYPGYNAQSTAAYRINKKPPCVYSKQDRLFAAVALILGYLVVKTYMESVAGTGFGLMASVTAAAVSIFNFAYCRNLGMKGSRTTTIIFIVNLLLSPSFFVCDNGSVTSLCVLMIVLGNAYFSYASYREGSRSVIHNAFRAVISPFHEYGSVFGALFHHTKKADGTKKTDMKKIGAAVFGVVMSIPVCIAVIALLSSADASFGSIFSFSLDDIAEWLDEYIIANLFTFVFSLPVGMYIFSAAYSRAYKMKNENVLDKLPHTITHILPQSMCAAFLTPLTLIYVLFVGLQIVHAFSANVLNAPDFSYAEYAREGFFQLCAVSVINLSVISVVMFFAKQDNKRLPKLLRLFVVIFSLLTHCLIATALAKMVMYINIYGMTPKRVQTSVFMAYLFIMFAVLIVKQFRTRISFTKIGYCLAAAVLIAMAFVPVDALIARYNIEKYRSGEISWMGEAAIYDLDSSAVPEFDHFHSDDPDAERSVNTFFHDREYIAEAYDHMTMWDMNIQRARAAKVIEDNI